MEGAASLPFRKAISTIGGFDEATREFISLPNNAHIPSLIKVYDPLEMAPHRLAPQIMTSDPDIAKKATLALLERGAHRVDLNCGCPSNTVTGRGAGSSLLKDPKHLYLVLRAMKEVSPSISIKIRSGYEDTHLFEEILWAIEDVRPLLLTIHPRTKKQGYSGRADWSLIHKAKKLLTTPICGSGDITSRIDLESRQAQTAVDAIMIGRTALRNPWIFQQIRNEEYKVTLESKNIFLETFYRYQSQKSSLRGKVRQLKQLVSFLFENEPVKRKKLLILQESCPLRYFKMLQHAYISSF